MPATILDVAKLCGYSKATVSRAFVSPERVAEKTREKIYKAAQQLDYTPDAIARAMVRGRTDNIGFIIYEKQYPVVLTPFYSPIFESVLQTCVQKGYSLFIASDSDLRLPNGQCCVKKQLDGVILAGHSDERLVSDLRRHNMSVVLLNNSLDMEDLICVTTDQYGGAVLAPIVLTFCIAGAFSTNNRIYDIYIILIFGIIAYFLRRMDFQPVPILLGIVLAPLAEKNFRRAMVISEGSFSIFFTRPISCAFIVIAIGSVLVFAYKNYRTRKRIK